MKEVLSLLCNNKSEDPYAIKIIFEIWGRSNSNFAEGLFPTNTTIRGYTKSVELIDFNQHR